MLHERVATSPALSSLARLTRGESITLVEPVPVESTLVERADLGEVSGEMVSWRLVGDWSVACLALLALPALDLRAALIPKQSDVGTGNGAVAEWKYGLLDQTEQAGECG